MRGRDLSNFRNTRALGVSNQTPPFLYGLYLSRSLFFRSHLTFRTGHRPFSSRASLAFFPFSLLSSIRHPFHALSRYNPRRLVSPSFPLESRFGSANDSRFLNSAATCRQHAFPRCELGRFPVGNTVPEIENRISQGTTSIIGIVVYILLR